MRIQLNLAEASLRRLSYPHALRKGSRRKTVEPPDTETMLAQQIAQLKPEKIKHICNVIAEASIASEVTGASNARRIFRQAKNRSLGVEKRVYALLESANKDQLERMKQEFLNERH